MEKLLNSKTFLIALLMSTQSGLWANDIPEKAILGDTPLPESTIQTPNSITLFSGPVYMANTRVFHPAIMLEYERIVRIKNREFGLQFGSELLLTNDMPDDLHAGFSFGVGFDISGLFEVAIGPTVIYHDQHFAPGWFISVGKMFDVGKYTLGPLFEYTKHEDDVHLFLGIGIGIKF